MDDPALEEFDDELLELGGFVSSPLWFSAVSTSCWTVATSEAIAEGVPLAPSAGSAFNCFKACSSFASSAWEGCDFRVTTI